MPSIIKRISKTTGKASYQAKVRVKGYPPESETFSRRTDAVRWAQRIEADMKDDKHFSNAKAKKHTASDLIDKYLAHLKGVNFHRHEEVVPLLNWWKGEIGHLLLSHVKTSHIEDGQQKLIARPKPKNPEGSNATISPSTVNRYRVALHTAFKYGKTPLKWIQENPVDEIKKLTEPEGRVRYLSDDEKEALLAACKVSQNPLLFAIVVLAVATGARRGEIENLRWADVNDDCTAITLPKTKNKKIRAIYLTGIAGVLVQTMYESRKPDDIYLFPSPYDPSRPINFESSWRNARTAAKLVDFRFHDLRHTCASYLAMNSASTLQIAETLGHKTLAMVQRYAHLCPTHTASVVADMTEKRLGHVEV